MYDIRSISQLLCNLVQLSRALFWRGLPLLTSPSWDAKRYLAGEMGHEQIMALDPSGSCPSKNRDTTGGCWISSASKLLLTGNNGRGDCGWIPRRYR